MQTFLPYPSFAESAKVLDRQRLGNQRNEACTILYINLGLTKGGGWVNHPAVKMWKGYSGALAWYGYIICRHWVERGYKDSVHGRFEKIIQDCCPSFNEAIAPSWLGDPQFHSSHRSALLFKNTPWYSQFGWTEEPKMAYVWPKETPWLKTSVSPRFKEQSARLYAETQPQQ